MSEHVEGWADKLESKETIAVEGPWQLKVEIEGELRIWVNGVSLHRAVRTQRLIRGEWITDRVWAHGKWRAV